MRICPLRKDTDVLINSGGLSNDLFVGKVKNLWWVEQEEANLTYLLYIWNTMLGVKTLRLTRGITVHGILYFYRIFSFRVIVCLYRLYGITIWALAPKQPARRPSHRQATDMLGWTQAGPD